MFNIGEKTKIIGGESVRSISHLQHQLYADKTAQVDYTYFGARVQRGTVRINTADGFVSVDFDVRNGWAREIKIRKED